MRYASVLVALAAVGANAGGFADGQTCYSWSGGHKSAGSFSKCIPELQAYVPPAKPVAPPQVVAPMPVPAAVAPTPIMMPVCQNPEPPSPKPKIVAKKKPVVNCK